MLLAESGDDIVALPDKVQGQADHVGVINGDGITLRAPELFEVDRYAEIDERTDVWSLGCTLFAMAYGTGQSPFDGTAMSAVSGRVAFPPQQVSAVAGDG